MRSNKENHNNIGKVSSLVLGAAVLATLLLVTTGCGGAATPGGNPGGGPPVLFSAPPTTATQVWVGAEPTDRILAMQLRVSSVQLKKSSDANATNDLLGTSDLELMRLTSTPSPVAIAGVIPNTFDQLQMSVSGARITYVDVNGTVQKKDVASDQTSLLTLNPPVIVGDIPTMLSIAVDVNQTVQLDPVNQVVTLNAPVLTVVQSDIPGSGGILPAAMHKTRAASALNTNGGQIERLVGQVVDATGGQILLQLGQSGSFLTLSTDSNTMFDNASPDTVNGMIVEVKGRAMTDGSLYASSVQAMSADSGLEVEGMLAGSNPSGSLNLVSGDGVGAGMTADLVGATITVSSAQDPGYMVDLGGDDMSGLPLLFDSSHVAAGQRIELRSNFGLQPDTDGNAAQAQPYLVELLHQTLQGTIQNYQPGSDGSGEFDLVLAPSTALKLMGGNSTVHVYQRFTTQTSVSIANEAPVNVRGLLFCTDATDSVPPGTTLHFAMVATSLSGND